MRYTIIHHDIRERFQITVSEYIICDSIHQLSHREPYKHPLKQIGDFVGVSSKTVWRARDVLLEKKLIEKVSGGFRTTDLWFDAVTKKKADKMSTQSGQNDAYTIYKESNTTEQSSEITLEPIDDDDSKVRVKKEPANAKYESLCLWAEDRRGFKFVRRAKQYASLKKAKQMEISPTRLKNRWEKLEGEEFYQEKGLDWAMVVSSFDKQA